jgi:hypothetical protein
MLVTTYKTTVSQPRKPQSIWLELYSFRFAVNNFEHEASKAKLDLTGDSEETLRKQSRLKRWDRKKKKMVAVNMVSNCVSLCIKSFDLVVSLLLCNHNWFIWRRKLYGHGCFIALL